MLRFILGVYIQRQVSSTWPLATWTVNIVGSLIIGMLFGYMMDIGSKPDFIRLLLITGFCGGFTTFSAFSLENVLLLQQGHYSQFFLYALTSIGLGLIAVYLGFKLFQI